ncbi:MAG: nucleotide-binding protein [Candidatus Zixiibacteriota bacterium]
MSRFEVRHERPFTVLELLSFLKADPQEMFVQLQYLDKHKWLCFNPDLRFSSDKVNWYNNLTQQLDFQVGAKLEMMTQLPEYERHNAGQTTQPKKHAKGGPKLNCDSTKSVFIAHGRDNGRLNSVARFVEKLGLRAVVLKEQASSGNTVIEKLESHTDVTYGIIIMVPEDEGRLRSDSTWRPRARQNVVLEHGYLMGKLGRSRVACLVVDDDTFDRPSDVGGVLYIAFDDQDRWQMELMKELKAAGLPIDANKAL